MSVFSLLSIDGKEHNLKISYVALILVLICYSYGIQLININHFINSNHYQTCTYEKLSMQGNTRASWLMAVTELDYYRSNHQEIPMVCQKIVGTDGKHSNKCFLYMTFY